MTRDITSIQDVVKWGLCTGCGACFYACSKQAVTLVNIEQIGIRPKFDSANCSSCTTCLSICPGYRVDNESFNAADTMSGAAEHEFGSALEIWEGFASDPEIRFKASSGGVLSALALYCLERENMDFVLHSGMDETKPWTNKTFHSRNRSEILARAGSRYAPTSPCGDLRAIEQSKGPCVFIGKPCDSAAVAMLREQRPELDKRLGLVLTFFCAGTPSTRGTLDLFKSLGTAPEAVNAVRYRGEGWPGRFKVLSENGVVEKSLSYAESWGKLADYRSLRCHLCPDGMGSLADISCGDAWESSGNNGDIGRSIVIVRSRRGREILHRAMAANFVELQPLAATAVLAAQPNLLGRRRELFGRLLAMKLMLVPSPQFKGFSLFRSWVRLSIPQKMRTVLGTLRRLIYRGLWRRRPVF